MFTRTTDSCVLMAGEAGVDGAGVAVIDRPAVWEIIAATDPLARLIDDTQFAFGEGPASDTAASSQETLVPDIGDPAAIARWPVLLGELAEVGVGALFAFPVTAAPTTSVVTMYRRSPGQLSRRQLTRARCRAAVTAIYIERDWDQFLAHGLGDIEADRDTVAEFLAQAPGDGFADRNDINVATGFVAARDRLLPDDALDVLRAQSFRTRTPLVEVARAVISAGAVGQ